MGKNDDFAARHARIKEQANAPDPTRGTPTDPRRARTLPSHTVSLMDTTNQFSGLKLMLGLVAALALAAFFIN